MNPDSSMWIPDGDKLVGNPFAEKDEALTMQAETGGEIPHCLTCDKELPYQPGVVLKYCNKTCRKNRPKGRRKLSKNKDIQ